MTTAESNVIVDAQKAWESNKKIVDAWRAALLQKDFLPPAFHALLDSQQMPKDCMLPAQIIHIILNAGDIGKGSATAVITLQEKLASGAEIVTGIEAAAWLASIAKTIKEFPPHDPCSDAAALRATRPFTESHPVLARLLTDFELRQVKDPAARTWALWSSFVQENYVNYATNIHFDDRSQAKRAHANAVASTTKGSANAASVNPKAPALDKPTAAKPWCFVCNADHHPIHCPTAKEIVQLAPDLKQLQRARFHDRPVTITVNGPYEGKKYEKGCGRNVLKQLKSAKPTAKANAAATAAGGGGAAAESDED